MEDFKILDLKLCIDMKNVYLIHHYNSVPIVETGT